MISEYINVLSSLSTMEDNNSSRTAVMNYEERGTHISVRLLLPRPACRVLP